MALVMDVARIKIVASLTPYTTETGTLIAHSDLMNPGKLIAVQHFFIMVPVLHRLFEG
jgi:hypothetical protein